MIKQSGNRWCLYTKDGSRKLGCHATKAEAEAQEKAVHVEKYARQLTLETLAGYKTRTEQFNGREHLVVPIVALVEGVVHAMNAKGNEFVPADELRAEGWNGRPIFAGIGHPLVNGRPVSGNTPELLEQQSIGTVFNATVKGKKLMMEAWIDVEKATEVDPSILERVNADEPIEISVGVFVDTDDEAGEHNGKKYLGSWHDIMPDHLALLPEGAEGACSRKMGCGVRAAKGATLAEKKKDSTCGAIFARIMEAFRGAQPADEMSDNDLRKKLSEALRALEPMFSYTDAWYPVTDPSRVVYSCYHQSESTSVEHSMGYQMKLYERAFTLSDAGLVTVGDARVEVEPVLSYEPVLMAEEPTVAVGKRNSSKDQAKIQAMHDHALALGAYCEPPIVGAKLKGACGCSTSEEKSDMDKTQITKFLETATPEQLAALSAVADGTAATLKAAAEKEAADKTAADAAAKVTADAALKAAACTVKPPTFEELLAAADPALRDSINAGKRDGETKKAATIKALRDTGRCDLTDAELGAKTQTELDQLVRLSGVRAAVDFSGQGAPKLGDEKKEVPPAPDLVGAIRAAREKK